MHIQAPQHDKLDPRSIKCMFLGYSSTQRGYKCFNPATNKFEETIHFFDKKCIGSSERETWDDLFPLPHFYVDIDFELVGTNHDLPPTSQQQSPQYVHYFDSTTPQSCDNTTSSPLNSQDTDMPQIRRNPPKARQPPLKLLDYVTYTVKHLSTDFVSYHRCSTFHQDFLSSILSHTKLKTFQEATL